MAFPAATEGSEHICPMSEGAKPHIGGPAQKGSSNVTFGGKSALRIGDNLKCNGPMDRVTNGSQKVFINGRGAARINDASAHGGGITSGINSVLIG